MRVNERERASESANERVRVSASTRASARVQMSVSVSESAQRRGERDKRVTLPSSVAPEMFSRCQPCFDDAALSVALCVTGGGGGGGGRGWRKGEEKGGTRGGRDKGVGGWGK